MSFRCENNSILDGNNAEDAQMTLILCTKRATSFSKLDIMQYD